MRFYWIRDRTSQRQFLIYWQPGITNLGDINGQEAVPICTLLRELGHPQPATQIQVYNSTDDGFANV